MAEVAKTEKQEPPTKDSLDRQSRTASIEYVVEIGGQRSWANYWFVDDRLCWLELRPGAGDPAWNTYELTKSALVEKLGKPKRSTPVPGYPEPVLDWESTKTTVRLTGGFHIATVHYGSKDLELLYWGVSHAEESAEKAAKVKAGVKDL